MKELGYDLETVTNADIENPQIKKMLDRGLALERMWQFTVGLFVLFMLVNFVLRKTLGKGAENWYDTETGTFMLILSGITFFVFCILFFIERRNIKKRWRCPKCKQKLPYYVYNGVTNARIIHEDVFKECHRRGLRLARRKGENRIFPDRCPNCREQFLKDEEDEE